jgi:lysyl-tRNA synthetase class I
MKTKIKAEDSHQISRARKKLEHQIERDRKELTQQALERIRRTIHRWIDRHAPERLSLRSKSITLFDENQHPAKIKNKFILNKLKNLRMRPNISEHRSRLTGRIKTHY